MAPSNIAVDNIILALMQAMKNDDVSAAATAVSATVAARCAPLTLCRVGHVARLMPAVLEVSLSHRVKASPEASLCADIRDELDFIGNRLKYGAKGGGGGGGGHRVRDAAARRRLAEMTFKELRDERRQLQRELRRREKAISNGVLRKSNIVLTTCVGAASHDIRALLSSKNNSNNDNNNGNGSGGSGNASNKAYFDLVVIDEAAQALEGECWYDLS